MVTRGAWEEGRITKGAEIVQLQSYCKSLITVSPMKMEISYLTSFLMLSSTPLTASFTSSKAPNKITEKMPLVWSSSLRIKP